MGAIQGCEGRGQSEVPQGNELLLPATVMGVQHEYAPYLYAYEDARL